MEMFGVGSWTFMLLSNEDEGFPSIEGTQCAHSKSKLEYVITNFNRLFEVRFKLNPPRKLITLTWAEQKLDGTR
jgi:hypothetical protein